MNSDLRQAAKEYMVRYGGDTFPNLFRSAKGCIVVDDTGREILDFTSGQMCATIGHNHPAIVQAVQEAGEKAYHMFSGMIPEVVAQLDAALWSFGGESQFLAHCQGGADAAVLQRSPTVLVTQIDSTLPHSRVLLNLSGQMPTGFARFERVVEVVSADDEQDRQLARQRWREYAAQGYAIERRDLVMKTED